MPPTFTAQMPNVEPLIQQAQNRATGEFRKASASLLQNSYLPGFGPEPDIAAFGRSQQDRPAPASRAAPQSQGDRIASLGSGAQSPAPAANAPAGSDDFGAASPLIALIDKHEGGGDYATLFGHSQREGRRWAGTDVSQMTLDQLSDFAAVDGEYGQWVKGQLAASGQDPRVATPMGRHQIVGTTLRNTAAAMGLSGDTVFNAQTQNAMFDHLASQRLGRASSMAGKRKQLRAEWEGFKHVSDDELNAAITAYEGG